MAADSLVLLLTADATGLISVVQGATDASSELFAAIEANAVESGTIAGEGYISALNKAVSAGSVEIAGLPVEAGGAAGTTAGTEFASGLNAAVASGSEALLTTIDTLFASITEAATAGGTSAGEAFSAALSEAVTAGTTEVAATVDASLGGVTGAASAAGAESGAAFGDGVAASAATGLGKVQSLIGVAIGGIFAKSGVAEAVALNRTVAGLGDALQGAGQDAGVTATSLDQLAQKVQASDVIFQGHVKSAEALLLTLGDIKNQAGAGNDVFDRTITVAGAMANVFGRDLNAQVIQLGRALENPVSGMQALQRSGTTLTTQEKDQITTLAKHGELLQAQTTLLDILQGRYDTLGSAEAHADPLQQFKLSFTQFKTQVGEDVLPVFGAVLRGVDDLLTTFEDSGPAIRGATEALIAFAAVYLPLQKFGVVNAVKSLFLPSAAATEQGATGDLAASGTTAASEANDAEAASAATATKATSDLNTQLTVLGKIAAGASDALVELVASAYNVDAALGALEGRLTTLSRTDSSVVAKTTELDGALAGVTQQANEATGALERVNAAGAETGTVVTGAGTGTVVASAESATIVPAVASMGEASDQAASDTALLSTELESVSAQAPAIAALAASIDAVSVAEANATQLSLGFNEQLALFSSNAPAIEGIAADFDAVAEAEANVTQLSLGFNEQLSLFSGSIGGALLDDAAETTALGQSLSAAHDRAIAFSAGVDALAAKADVLAAAAADAAAQVALLDKALADGVITEEAAGTAANTLGLEFDAAGVAASSTALEMADLATAEDATATSAFSLSSALSGIGLVAGGLFIVGGLLKEMGNTAPSLDALTKASTDFAKSGLFGGALSQTLGPEASNIGTIIRNAEESHASGQHLGPLTNIADRITSGLGLGPSQSEIQTGVNSINAIDAALAQLESKDPSTASAVFKYLGDAAVASGHPISELVALLPQYVAAQADAASHADALGKSVTSAADAFAKFAGEAAKQDTLNQIADSYDKIDKAAQKYAADVSDANGTSEKAIAANQAVTDAQQGVAAADQALVDSHQKLTDAYTTLQDAQDRVTTSTDALRQAQQALAEFNSPRGAEERALAMDAIQRRVETTPAGEDQKQLDILKLQDSQAAEPTKLQDAILNAQTQVRNAYKGVTDAQDAIVKDELGIQAATDNTFKAQDKVAKAIEARQTLHANATAAMQGDERAIQSAYDATIAKIQSAIQNGTIEGGGIQNQVTLLEGVNAKYGNILGSQLQVLNLQNQINSATQANTLLNAANAGQGPVGFQGPPGGLAATGASSPYDPGYGGIPSSPYPAPPGPPHRSENGLGPVVYGASGNIFAFAEGTEDHVAQIAMATGAKRVWAEPETGGEAYIPLADSKRTRSTSILATVAEKFGLQLVSANDAKQLPYADGGLMSRSTVREYDLGGMYADGGTDWPSTPTPARTTRGEAQNASRGDGGLTIHNENHFHGSEAPALADLEFANRALGWRIARMGRGG